MTEIATTPITAAPDELAAVTYNSDGLVAAIVQDIATNEILMMAWMNAETLQMSLDQGRTVFWSRSRQEVWRKGDTSGDRQFIREAYYDCDGDTLLLPTRELRRAVRQAIPEADDIDHPIEMLPIDLLLRQRERQQDVLLGRERANQVERLEDEADLVPSQQSEGGRIETGDLGGADERPTGGERVEAGSALHERRLARAGRTHDCREFGRLKIYVDGIECNHSRVAFSINLGQSPCVGGCAHLLRLLGRPGCDVDRQIGRSSTLGRAPIVMVTPIAQL